MSFNIWGKVDKMFDTLVVWIEFGNLFTSVEFDMHLELLGVLLNIIIKIWTIN